MSKHLLIVDILIARQAANFKGSRCGVGIACKRKQLLTWSATIAPGIKLDKACSHAFGYPLSPKDLARKNDWTRMFIG
jgi:hypothetical protein